MTKNPEDETLVVADQNNGDGYSEAKVIAGHQVPRGYLSHLEEFMAAAFLPSSNRTHVSNVAPGSDNNTFDFM